MVAPYPWKKGSIPPPAMRVVISTKGITLPNFNLSIRDDDAIGIDDPSEEIGHFTCRHTVTSFDKRQVCVAIEWNFNG